VQFKVKLNFIDSANKKQPQATKATPPSLLLYKELVLARPKRFGKTRKS
jgi:hypothetical protein